MALPEDGEITSTSLTVAEYRSLLDNLVSDVAKGYTEYNSGRPYDKGAVILASDYWPYISQVDSNSGNDPLVDDGTNWRIDDKALTVFAAMFTQGVQSDICRLVVGTTVDSYDYGIFSDNDGYTLWDLSGETGTLTGSFNKSTGTASGMSGTAVRVDGIDPNDLGTAAYADLTVSQSATSGVLQAGDGGLNNKVQGSTQIDWESFFDGLPSGLPLILTRSDSTNKPISDVDNIYPMVFSFREDTGNKSILGIPYRANIDRPVLWTRNSSTWNHAVMFTSAHIASPAEIISGTRDDVPVVPSELGAANVTVRKFVSPAQTITSGALLTIPHGLGDVPMDAKMFLTCTTADLSYSVGDTIITDDNNDVRVNSIRVDNTNIYIRFSDNSQCFTSSTNTGDAQALTNSRWELRVKAWV